MKNANKTKHTKGEKSEASHIPTPWNISYEEGSFGCKQRIGIENKALDKEVIVPSGFLSVKDAEFIVRAVNSHEALLEIAKAYKEALTGGSLHWTEELEMKEKIDKAIAQAEGK